MKIKLITIITAVALALGFAPAAFGQAANTQKPLKVNVTAPGLGSGSVAVTTTCKDLLQNSSSVVIHQFASSGTSTGLFDLTPPVASVGNAGSSCKVDVNGPASATINVNLGYASASGIGSASLPYTAVFAAAEVNVFVGQPYFVVDLGGRHANVLVRCSNWGNDIGSHVLYVQGRRTVTTADFQWLHLLSACSVQVVGESVVSVNTLNGGTITVPAPVTTTVAPSTTTSTVATTTTSTVAPVTTVAPPVTVVVKECFRKVRVKVAGKFRYVYRPVVCPK